MTWTKSCQVGKGLTWQKLCQLGTTSTYEVLPTWHDLPRFVIFLKAIPF